MVTHRIIKNICVYLCASVVQRNFNERTGPEKLVDILKNYMANKSFSRDVETLGAEASMAFVGNTQHTVPYMLKHSNLF